MTPSDTILILAAEFTTACVQRDIARKQVEELRQKITDLEKAAKETEAAVPAKGRRGNG